MYFGEVWDGIYACEYVYLYTYIHHMHRYLHSYLILLDLNQLVILMVQSPQQDEFWTGQFFAYLCAPNA